eukprot:2070580-Pleurochrysis_carterae.AAC.3
MRAQSGRRCSRRGPGAVGACADLTLVFPRERRSERRGAGGRGYHGLQERAGVGGGGRAKRYKARTVWRRRPRSRTRRAAACSPSLAPTRHAAGRTPSLRPETHGERWARPPTRFHTSASLPVPVSYRVNDGQTDTVLLCLPRPVSARATLPRLCLSLARSLARSLPPSLPPPLSSAHALPLPGLACSRSSK